MFRLSAGNQPQSSLGISAKSVVLTLRSAPNGPSPLLHPVIRRVPVVLQRDRSLDRLELESCTSLIATRPKESSRRVCQSVYRLMHGIAFSSSRLVHFC
jgi:hypothetical protein